eukprot:gnl/TRDRNA2_/TRDRNA2_173420_c0_seq1.p1 gnl/TRDRNA2_/TRDRNA2_173420_c0~~gnl/TRDRNA2_/TRDRNA2_173420_c0_seq1.p1  ORF type:complete len:1194 (+),score=226.87 gnl/TRDRNA2_/TRDRNA2_173420_c0_seq1:348-3584(+)
MEFKRRILRYVRICEFGVFGRETWYDEEADKIIILEQLPEDKLPPNLPETVGQVLDPWEKICCGGDYDQRLVVVLSGVVEKLIGDSTGEGRIITKRLQRGDYEGITEFVGAGTEQRTYLLRADGGGAKVRFVPREPLLQLLEMKLPLPPKERTMDDFEPEEKDSDVDTEEWEEEQQRRLEELEAMSESSEDSDAPPPVYPDKWPDEVVYFAQLRLDRIDSLPHKDARQLLQWDLGGEDVPGLDLIKLPGQSLFYVDDCLGMSQSGPLPEGIEDRFFFDGQMVIHPGRASDSLIMILRGELEAEVPADCGESCVPQPLPEKPIPGSWLGDGRRPKKEVEVVEEVAERSDSESSEEEQHEDDELRQRLGMRAIVGASNVKPKNLVEEPIPEEVAPEPKEPIPPRSILGPGQMVGYLGLMGMPMMFSGAIRAKGPCLVAILHRMVLKEALKDSPEWQLFEPEGVDKEEMITILSTPPAKTVDPRLKLGPATGPPLHMSTGPGGPPSGTISAWRNRESPYYRRPGADAQTLVLLRAIQHSHLLWEIVENQPQRLLYDLVCAFEPRWLLPGDVVVADEERCDCMFIMIHGSFLVSVVGQQIFRLGEDDVVGEAQLLGLLPWTRDIKVDPALKGEALVQVLRREKLLEVTDGHPAAKYHLREIEAELAQVKDSSWECLRKVPAFMSIPDNVFLARIYQDSDILLFCPGDHIAEKGADASSLIVILAGSVRAEQPQTLFAVELQAGDFMSQPNVLGNETLRSTDIVGVTHTMVLFMHRHVLLGAISDFPHVAPLILENEEWRQKAPQLSSIQCLEGVPPSAIAKLESEARHGYFKVGVKILAAGSFVENDCLMVMLRGQARVTIFGTEVRILKEGDVIGLQRFMGLEMPSPSTDIHAIDTCDVICLTRKSMDELLANHKYIDDLAKFSQAVRILSGAPIVDALGFPLTEEGKACVPDCVEKSKVFSECRADFVSQIPQFVEDIAYWPGDKLFKHGDPGDFLFFIKVGRVKTKVVGSFEEEVFSAGDNLGETAVLSIGDPHKLTAICETHVWARVLSRKLLVRALKSFPEEEKRLMGRKKKSDSLF